MGRGAFLDLVWRSLGSQQDPGRNAAILGTPVASSPGARHLLIQAEAAAERGLHVARGVLWAVLFLVYLGPMGVRPPAALVLLGLVGFIALWTWLWRLMSRPPLPPRLKYVLIVADCWVIVRASITRWLVAGWFGASFSSDMLAVSPPLLVYLALSGALRLDPAAAAFSTAMAMVGFGVIVAVEGEAVRQATAVGTVILFAGTIGVGIAHVLRYIALKALEGEVLGHYVPETLTRELSRTGDPGSAGRQEDVTVLVVDMRGFTRLSERLAPAVAVSLLNRYFGVVVTPLTAEGAILDRYLGDGLLAHFEGEDRAARALRAAMAIRRQLDLSNAAHPEREPVVIGIAIHAGPVIVGAIGPPTRREYTIIGDAVNVTDRLEKFNKDLDSVIVASVEALAGVGDPSRHGFLGPRLVTVRGHDAPLSILYLLRDVPVLTASATS